VAEILIFCSLTERSCTHFRDNVLLLPVGLVIASMLDMRKILVKRKQYGRWLRHSHSRISPAGGAISWWQSNLPAIYTNDCSCSIYSQLMPHSSLSQRPRQIWGCQGGGVFCSRETRATTNVWLSPRKKPGPPVQPGSPGNGCYLSFAFRQARQRHNPGLSRPAKAVHQFHRIDAHRPTQDMLLPG
jgi:hypothetical protein